MEYVENVPSPHSKALRRSEEEGGLNRNVVRLLHMVKAKPLPDPHVIKAAAILNPAWLAWGRGGGQLVTGRPWRKWQTQLRTMTCSTYSLAGRSGFVNSGAGRKTFLFFPRLSSGLTVGTAEACWVGVSGELSRPESAGGGGQETSEGRTGCRAGSPRQGRSEERWKDWGAFRRRIKRSRAARWDVLTFPWRWGKQRLSSRALIPLPPSSKAKAVGSIPQPQILHTGSWHNTRLTWRYQNSPTLLKVLSKLQFKEYHYHVLFKYFPCLDG